MGLPEWLEVSANSVAIVNVVVRSVLAWRSNRKPMEPQPPSVRMRCDGRECVIDDDTPNPRE